MKRRPDLNLPSFSTPELQVNTSMHICNTEEKGWPKSYYNGLGEPRLSGQKRGPQCTNDSCSTNLALGNANFSGDDLETKPVFLDISRSSEQVRNLIEHLNKNQHDRSSRITPHYSNNLLFKASDSKTPTSNSLSTNSLNHTMDPCFHPKTDHANLDISPSTYASTLESPNSSRYSPCITGDMSDYHPIDTFLSLSLCGFTGESRKAGKKSRVCGTPPLVDQKVGLSCYEPPKLTHFDISVSGGRSNRVENIELASHRLLKSYPSNLSLSISSNDRSPESKLKNSAESYKNTPSIIRKKFVSESAKPSYSSSLSTRSIISCDSESKDCNCLCLTSEKGCLHPKGFKSGTSLGEQPLERRLEYAFDLEWDSATGRRCSPCSKSPSSELNFDAKMMLTP